MYKLVLVCLVVCVCGVSGQLYSAGTTPIINTTLGSIFGHLFNTYGLYDGIEQRKMYAFLGVPYGKPPLGTDRFKPAEAAGPWGEELLNATRWASKCVQWGEGEEDCLYLHIFTPEPEDPADLPNMNLPVMFWVHGGGFSSGEAQIYLPGRLLNYDIVLVVIHYRLGPLGYLCLPHDDVPGNAGMFDQVLALEWVRDNIQEYGGDPGRVTVFGESAGGASSALHLLSTESKDLFHGVIGQSGSALSEWSVDRHPQESVIEIAKYAGWTGDENNIDMGSLVTFLQEVDPLELSNAYSTYSSADRKVGGLGFGGSCPCVQQAGERKFIDTHPQVLMKTTNFTHVPTMFGANRHEGSFVLGLAYHEFLEANGLENDTDFLENQLMKVVMKGIAIFDTSSATEQALMQKHMYNASMGNITSMSPGIMDIFGVWMLKHGGYVTVKKQSEFADSYLYSFDYQGRWSLYGFIAGPTWEVPFKTGVSHAHELPYLFNLPFPLNREEIDISHMMTQLWTNFAIYGNPTPPENPVPGCPTWPKFDPDSQPYLMINEETTVKYDYTKTYTIAVEDALVANNSGNNWPVPVRLPDNFRSIHLDPEEAIEAIKSLGEPEDRGEQEMDYFN